MNVEQYIVLSGRNVPTSGHRLLDAQIRRARTHLESLLGFTLEPEKVNTNFYNELGKTKRECACSNVTGETLNDPDEVFGAYRLYSYNPLDEYLHVDPFYTVHKVKLVRDNVTIRDIDPFVPIYKEDWGKYVELCQDCLCFCNCVDCLQLAVDADWCFPDLSDGTVGDSSVGSVTGLPEDLLYVWIDYVDFYVDSKSNIRSESVGAHSYTKFDNLSPKERPENRQILAKYAGPKGNLAKLIV